MNEYPEGEEEQDIADPAGVDEGYEDNVSLDSENEDEIFQDDDIEDNEESESESDEEDDIEDTESQMDDESFEEEGETEQALAEPVKKDKKQDSDENAKYATARRESEAKMLELKQRQDTFARWYGYENFEELEYAQKAQKFVDEGHDEETAKSLVERDELKARIDKLEHENRIKSEKMLLSKKQYFKELEPEIDVYLSQNPSLPVELIFNTLRGRRFEELMEQKTKAVKQKTMNDAKSKAHLKPDGKNADIKAPSVSDEEYKMYCKLNTKPVSKADYAKWKSEN